MTQEKLEEARKLYQTANADQKYVLESLFPELAESEDEKVRKEIIATIHLYYGEPLENEAKEMIAWLEKQGEQKHAEWSKEDEKMLANACIMLDWYKGNNWWTAQYIKDWLKSLKYGVQPKQEWSEEDESLRLRTIGALETCKIGSPTKCVDEQINWLKSLKDRYTWKPSDEQMEALKDAKKGVFRFGILESLYNDLEKLKGE